VKKAVKKAKETSRLKAPKRPPPPKKKIKKINNNKINCIGFKKTSLKLNKMSILFFIF